MHPQLEILLEIQDLSRDHIAKLDTKIRLLTQLLQDCDRKKAEIEALLGRSTSPAPAPGRPANPLHEQVYTLLDAGQDVVNPGSVILSGVMMLEYMGWQEAAELIVRGLERAIAAKTVTYDFERQMEGAKKVKCSEFADEMIKHMG